MRGGSVTNYPISTREALWIAAWLVAVIMALTGFGMLVLSQL